MFEALMSFKTIIALLNILNMKYRVYLPYCIYSFNNFLANDSYYLFKLYIIMYVCPFLGSI